MTDNHNSLISKPEWLRVKAPQVERIGNTANLLNDLKLNTVCQEASCPNIGECFSSGTATFLIMGPVALGPVHIVILISTDLKEFRSYRALSVSRSRL